VATPKWNPSLPDNRLAVFDPTEIFQSAVEGLTKFGEGRSRAIGEENLAKAWNAFSQRPQQAAPNQELFTTSTAQQGTAGNSLLDNLLETIKRPESGGNYNVMYGGTEAPLTDMTINEVRATQQQHLQNQLANGAKEGSTAAGAYQIIGDTLDGLVAKMGLTGDEKFTPEMQDAMAIELAKEDGLEKFMTGQMSLDDFQNNLAKTWAGLPTTEGRSAYAGDAIGNAAGMSVDEFRNALQGSGGAVQARQQQRVPTSQNTYQSFMQSPEFAAALQATQASGASTEPLLEAARQFEEGNQQQAELQSDLLSDVFNRGRTLADTARIQQDAAWAPALNRSVIEGRRAQTALNQTRLSDLLEERTTRGQVRKFSQENAQRMQQYIEERLPQLATENPDADPAALRSIAQDEYKSGPGSELFLEWSTQADPKAVEQTDYYKDNQAAKEAHLATVADRQKLADKAQEEQIKLWGADVKYTTVGRDGQPRQAQKGSYEELRRNMKPAAVALAIKQNPELGDIFSKRRYKGDLDDVATLVSQAATLHRVDPELLIPRLQKYLNTGMLWGINDLKGLEEKLLNDAKIFSDVTETDADQALNALMNF
jgi:muramidase (phage lysozyme)